MAKQSNLTTPTSLPDFMYNVGDRIDLLKRVLKVLDNPDKQFKIIHICGTNGKGSTATMIAAILRQLNYRVGTFTSPFIGTLYNGIQRNFSDISKAQFDSEMAKIQHVMVRPEFNHDMLSEFEAQFVVAMLFFADHPVDYVVLECGLGGELDATNAVSNTMYSVFTEIGLDHLGILGNTVAEIATTKSKIIRQGNTTITAPHQRPEAFQILKSQAAAKQATFLSADQIHLTSTQVEGLQRIVSFQSAIVNQIQGKFMFGLPGTYQLENLATVLTWLNDFSSKTSVPTKHFDQILTAALGHLVIPGRFEQISTMPTIFLDGGHNPDGVAAFVSSVDELYGDRPKIIINGFLKDKEYQPAVKSLLTLKNASFIVTEPQNQKRELDAVKLSHVYRKLTNETIETFESSIDALKEAIHRAHGLHDKPTIFVVGSFYLLNPIRSYILAKGVDLHEN